MNNKKSNVDKNKESIRKILQGCNIKLNNYDHYSTAFTHSSCSEERTNVLNNEKYEFLGDRILNLVVADLVFHNTKGNKVSKYQHKYESIINNNNLIKVAKKLKFNELIILGSGQKDIGNNYLANCLEAFIAAIYLDNNKNLEVVDKFIKKYISNHIIKNKK